MYPHADKKNPWRITSGFARGCQTRSADDRISEIKESTDLKWLKRVVAYSGNQTTVQHAAEIRLRKLIGAYSK